MIDPMEVLKQKASSLPSVIPLPTAVPGNTPIYQKAGEVGHRTLWLVDAMTVIVIHSC